MSPEKSSRLNFYGVIDPSHVAARKREIVKQGRGYWSADIDVNGDLNRFYDEYVLPLRELSQQGVVGPLTERQHVLMGTARVSCVQVGREVDITNL